MLVLFLASAVYASLLGLYFARDAVCFARYSVHAMMIVVVHALFLLQLSSRLVGNRGWLGTLFLDL